MYILRTYGKLSDTMGFNQEDFIKAFSAALSDTTIIKKLKSAICDDLVKEVSSLREKVKKRDAEIAGLEARFGVLEAATDAQE